VARTEADVAETRAAIGYSPTTSVETGVARFVDWYLEHFGAQSEL
jgi:UDP-glucuronate 4-epimerase